MKLNLEKKQKHFETNFYLWVDTATRLLVENRLADRNFVDRKKTEVDQLTLLSTKALAVETKYCVS
jgi:hypothetical protein